MLSFTRMTHRENKERGRKSHIPNSERGDHAELAYPESQMVDITAAPKKGRIYLEGSGGEYTTIPQE